MINIAIDGPAGAGKSTAAKAAAKALGYIYVDTGALYRAVGLYVVERGADTKDEEQIVPLLKDLSVSLRFIGGEQRVFLGERDVTSLIRTPEISMAASDVSAHPKVRAFLFALQRDIAAKNNVIMDGRDIGTVVLPDADLKVFWTASAEARAGRRFRELTEKGVSADYNEVLAEIIRRDEQDSTRTVAPLKAAEGAVFVDNTDMNLEESVAYLLNLIRERLS